MSEITIVSMTADEARTVVGEINRNISNIRGLLLDLYERRGWESLGYSSWRECVTSEFQYRDTTLYNMLYAAQVDKNISSAEDTGIIPERHLRPLVPLEPDEQRLVRQVVVDTAPNGKVTMAHTEQVVSVFKEIKQAGNEELTASILETAVLAIQSAPPEPEQAFNYKRDAKSARVQDEYVPQGYDACQTPPYALDPLLPYLDNRWTVWEPACGEGLLMEALYDSGFKSVVTSDILTGQNFFEYAPPQWDVLVTNPPFSLKYRWLERCYELGNPFALLLPVETLGAKTAQDLMQRHGFEVLLLNRRVAFKMPNKGWDSHPQFPVMWLTWKLLPEAVMFGDIQPDHEVQEAD